jgi:hypothetical protein
VHLKSGLIRGVVSLERSSLVVFCYLVACEIWPDKRGGLSRGEQFKLLPSRETSPLIRPDFRCTDSKIQLNCSPLERPPLLSGQISDALIAKYY